MPNITKQQIEKDFDNWNIEKKKIHNKNEVVLFHEREIWWCALGANIGYEQDGKNKLFERPVLIIKKFNQDVLWVLPLTRSVKENKYYYRIEQGNERNSMVVLSQLRLISSKRLLRKMRTISKREFDDIINKIKEFFPKLL